MRINKIKQSGEYILNFFLQCITYCNNAIFLKLHRCLIKINKFYKQLLQYNKKYQLNKAVVKFEQQIKKRKTTNLYKKLTTKLFFEFTKKSHFFDIL